MGNLFLASRELFWQGIKPLHQFGYVHSRKFGYILISNTKIQCLFPQTRTLALRTGLFFHEIFCPTLHGGATFCILVLLFYEIDNSLKINRKITSYPHDFRFLREFFFSSEKNHIYSLFREFLHWVGEFVSKFPKYSFYLLEYPSFFLSSYGCDSPLLDRERHIRNELAQGYLLYYSQSITVRTHSFGRVKREGIRLW